MNLKTNVIAAEVENLTDARYFAAWGVDYISFDLQNDLLDTSTIKEIIDWIEGPQYYGHLTNVTIESDTLEKYNQLGLRGLIINPFIETDRVHPISQHIYREVLFGESLSELSEELLIIKLEQDFDMETHIEPLKLIAQNNELYIDGIYSVDQLDTILTRVNPRGIVLRGGAEEKVGFKSFDVLDELFEYLEYE